VAGLLITPGFVASHFSPDGILEKTTVQQIQLLRLLAIIIGILAAALSLLCLAYPSKVNKVFGFVSCSLPRFKAWLRICYGSISRSLPRLKASPFLSHREVSADSATGQVMENGFWAKLLSKDIFFISLIIIFVILFMLQFNMPPFERYPGWDSFWIDTRTAGGLLTMKQALLDGELPAITPYEEFGHNFAGDTAPTHYLSPFNLLCLVLPPAIVMVLRTAAYLNWAASADTSSSRPSPETASSPSSAGLPISVSLSS